MWIFIAAGVSDFLDGYLARAWQQQSKIGRMLDPIADKLIVSAALLMLAADRPSPAGRFGPASSSSAARSWSRACASFSARSPSACR